jgi:hypothetical protein
MISPLATHNSSIARWLRRARSRHVSQQSPVIIGGCPRSGTTLLRVMLDSHPRIACGPENSLLAGSFLPQRLALAFDVPVADVWRLRRQARDHARFIELFYSRYAESRHRPRWGDKRPHNIRFLDFIFRHFPRARVIHVTRDARDAVCSLRTHPKYRLVNGERVLTGIRRPLRPCIRMWLRDTAAGMNWRGHPGYCEVKYEDLVERPEPTLRSVCDFIGEPWDAAMLAYHEQGGGSRDPRRFVANFEATEPLTPQAIQRWRKDLTAAELQLVVRHAGHRLAQLGYMVGSASAPIPEPATPDPTTWKQGGIIP